MQYPTLRDVIFQPEESHSEAPVNKRLASRCTGPPGRETLELQCCQDSCAGDMVQRAQSHLTWRVHGGLPMSVGVCPSGAQRGRVTGDSRKFLSAHTDPVGV